MPPLKHENFICSSRVLGREEIRRRVRGEGRPILPRLRGEGVQGGERPGAPHRGRRGRARPDPKGVPRPHMRRAAVGPRRTGMHEYQVT